jgi:hypothetical protein
MEELEITLEQESSKELEIKLIREGGSGGGGAKEVHIGTDEPTGEETIWIDPSGEADKIPTLISELENDSKFVNEDFVTNKIAEAELSGGDVDLSDYAKKTDIPDVSGFITKDVNDLTNYYNKESINALVGNIEALLGGI